MNKRVTKLITPILLLLTVLLSVFADAQQDNTTAPAADNIVEQSDKTAANSTETENNDTGTFEVFKPTESIQGDQSVDFPVDI